MKKLSWMLLCCMLSATMVACGAANDSENNNANANNEVVSEAVNDSHSNNMNGNEEEMAADSEEMDDGEMATDEEVMDAVEGSDEMEAVDQEPEPVPTMSVEVADVSDALVELLPEFDEADIQETESGLKYVILEEGEGDSPASGDTVTAHYTGYLADGTKFDSSVDREETFSFPLGLGRVIPGWDEGFTYLKPGGKAILMIPASLGYGVYDSGPIPGNSTLFFDVELIDVQAVALRPDTDVDADSYTFVTDSVEADYEIGVYAVSEGDGEALTGGNQIGVYEFAAWTGDGEMLENSQSSGRPMTVLKGADNPTWIEAAIDGFKTGGVRQIQIPAPLLGGIEGDPDFLVVLEMTEIVSPPDAPQEFDGEYETISTTIIDRFSMPTEEGSPMLEFDVQFGDLVEGDGDEVVDGQDLSVVFHAWDTSTGELEMTSLVQEGGKIAYLIGSQQFPGWDEALVGMKIGGVRQIMIPSKLLEPNREGDIVFEVEAIGTTADAETAE